MRVIHSPQRMQTILSKNRREGKSVGFVPTMGALHRGHLALIERSGKANDTNVLSIFVNPTQFGPHEDLASYPRRLTQDLALAKAHGVDIAFVPPDKKMYPAPHLTSVHVEQLSGRLCGQYRPDHFRGVTTIVAKLLNIVQPHHLYLGQKDAQQYIILKKMIQDLHIPVKTVMVPTVREPDGLALSSRNQYLTPEQRRGSPEIYRSLCNARRAVKAGQRDARQLSRDIRQQIESATSGIVQYVELVDPITLQPRAGVEGETLVAVAVHFGTTRLIDNIFLQC